MEFTYSVVWNQDDTPFSARMDKLAGGGLLPSTFEVWLFDLVWLFGLVWSGVLVLFRFVSFAAIFLCRCARVYKLAGGGGSAFEVWFDFCLVFVWFLAASCGVFWCGSVW